MTIEVVKSGSSVVAAQWGNGGLSLVKEGFYALVASFPNDGVSIVKVGANLIVETIPGALVADLNSYVAMELHEAVRVASVHAYVIFRPQPQPPRKTVVIVTPGEFFGGNGLEATLIGTVGQAQTVEGRLTVQQHMAGALEQFSAVDGDLYVDQSVEDIWLEGLIEQAQPFAARMVIPHALQGVIDQEQEFVADLTNEDNSTPQYLSGIVEQYAEFLGDLDVTPLPIGHRYWGLEWVGKSGTSVGVAEVTMHEVPGGPNVLTGKTMQAANWYLQPSTEFGPSKANDGVFSSKFVVTTAQPVKRIWTDMGSDVSINQFGWRNATTSTNEFPQSATLVWSDDGVTWTPEFEVTGLALKNWVSGTYRIFENPDWVPPAKDTSAHRWWGIRAITANGSNAMAVTELELREEIGGANIAVSAGIAQSNTTYSDDATFGPQRAFDGLNNTKYASSGPGNAANGQFLVMQFPEAKTIREVGYRAAYDYPIETPTSFAVVWSDNGVDWTDALVVSGQTGWTQNQLRLFTVPVADEPMTGSAAQSSKAEGYLSKEVKNLANSRLIMLGASNTTQAWGNAQTIKTYAENKFEVTLEVNNQAVSGWRSSNLRDNIDGILANFANDKTTFVLVEIGGNDVSDNRPYLPDAAHVTALRNNITYIMNAIYAKGFIPILAELTFRDYGNTTITNEAQGSLPYNVNVIRPLVPFQWKDTDGRAYINYYDLIKDNYATFLQSDDVHLTEPGNVAMRDYLNARLIDRLFAGMERPLPAISHVAGTGVSLSASASSISVTVPAQVEEGDLLIASFFGVSDTLTAPAGWTEVLGSGAWTGGAFTRYNHVFKKIAGPSDANVSMSFSQGAAGRFYGQIAAFRSNDDLPLDVYASGTTTSASPGKSVALSPLVATKDTMGFAMGGSVYGDTPVTTSTIDNGWQFSSPAGYSENRLVTVFKFLENGDTVDATLNFTQNNGGTGERVNAITLLIGPTP